MVITSLDLFSGIGGNAFALRSIATPALYCESDPRAALLLRRAVSSGHLPAAPIHPDVRTLLDSPEYTKAKAMRPLAVSASWPCQGASLLGKRAGMDDPRSGLLRELVAVIADARPEVAFLENVPDVVNNGSLEFIAERLGEAYDIRFRLAKASDMGFFHERKRFFCVLLRKDYSLRHFSPAPVESLPTADAPEPPRTVAAKGPQWAAQVHAFGNSIVPACFYRSVLDMLGFPVPPLRPAPPLHIVLSPEAYAPPPGAALSPHLKRENILRAPLTKALWATPRATDSHACHFLTLRSCRDLTTMVRFAQSSPQQSRGDPINPAWLAWLMGFPPGYLGAGPL